jgi:hypothetical protein
MLLHFDYMNLLIICYPEDVILYYGDSSRAGLRICITLMRLRIIIFTDADPDPNFHIHVDLDPHQSGANFQPLVYKPFRAPF